MPRPRTARLFFMPASLSHEIRKKRQLIRKKHQLPLCIARPIQLARFNYVSGASVTRRRGKNHRMMLCAGVALGVLAPATPASAQGHGSAAPATPPPAPRPAPDAPSAAEPRPGQDDIVVTAPSQQSSIDRQTYLVRDTAEARSTTTSDILARIPSVEVQTDGNVRLVGAGQATILIDGRRVADPQTQLRNMTGAQIERIEVLTNPGAQFPAQGTGGVVNIVTRRNAQNGLGGSATASAGSYGIYDLRVSPTYGAGNWTFTGNAGHGRFEKRSRLRARALFAAAGRSAARLARGRGADRRGPLLLRQRLGQLPAERPPHDHAERHRRPYRLSRDPRLAADRRRAPRRQRRPALRSPKPTSIIGISPSTIAAPPPGRARR